MINVLFYGNCQIQALSKVLNLPQNQYNSHSIECFTTNHTEEQFLNIIKESQIIITQSIQNDYRNKTYLSTSYILLNCSHTSQIIIIDSCYFPFYHFDLFYYYTNNTTRLRTPCEYHYREMMTYFIQNKTIDEYINQIINNSDFKTQTELEEIAEKSIIELQQRFQHSQQLYSIYSNCKVITCWEYIKNEYKNKLLFYSFNHPTKYIFHYFGEHIISFLNLQNNINYEIDPLQHLKCIIYKCIYKVVNFDINQTDSPILKNCKNYKDIVKLYYDSYQSLKSEIL